MKFKNKNNQLMFYLYFYKAMLFFYFAMFIYTLDRNKIMGILLLSLLLALTHDSWNLVKNVFKLYRQEKD